MVLGAQAGKVGRRGVPQSRNHPSSERDRNAVQPDPRSTALIFRQINDYVRSGIVVVRQIGATAAVEPVDVPKPSLLK